MLDQGIENLVPGGAELLEQLARLAAVLHHRQQQMLGGNIFVFERLGFRFGALDDFFETRRDVSLAGGAGDLRQAVEGFLQALGHGCQRHAEFLQQR